MELLEVFFVNLELEIEFREIGPQGGFAFLELGQDPFAIGVGTGLGVFGPGFGDACLRLLRGFDEFRQGLEVALAAFDFFVDDDTVKALFAVEQLGPERGDVVADGRGVEQLFLGFELGILDAFGNFNFLLARQQRDLAHLLEIHADGIVEDVVLRAARLLLLGFFLALLVALDFIGVEDVDLKILQDGDNALDILRVIDGLGQGLVDVVKSEIALFLGETDERAYFLVHVAGRRIVAGGLLGRGDACAHDGGFDGFGLRIGGDGGLGGWLEFTARHRVARLGRLNDSRQLYGLAELSLNFRAAFDERKWVKSTLRWGGS